AALSNGTVRAWGQNLWGQLGDGTSSGPDSCGSGVPCSTTPVPVSGLSGVSAVAAGSVGQEGGAFRLALLDDGTVVAWGNSTGGALGIGASTGPDRCAQAACSTKPVPVSGVSGVSAIA